jgi:hypothetical protein
MVGSITSYRQRTGRTAGSDLRVAVVTASPRQRVPGPLAARSRYALPNVCLDACRAGITDK